jgi:hypothetical protein
MGKDNEIPVNGGDYGFGERIYASSLGRWLSEDHSSYYYPNLSPYSFVYNTPIINIFYDVNDYTISITKYDNGNQTRESDPNSSFENDLNGIYGGSKLNKIHLKGYINTYNKLIDKSTQGAIIKNYNFRNFAEKKIDNKTLEIIFKEEWKQTTLHYEDPNTIKVDSEKFRNKILVGQIYVEKQ